MPSDSLLIEVIDLKKEFTDFWGRKKVEALKGVNLQVPKGTIFGLLGPNGAGKSTLIKLILGHLHPSSGILRVLGSHPRDVQIKSRIGYLPERTAFWPTLTARETLDFFGRLHGIPEIELKKRRDQLLSMVGIDHTADRLVGEFSHGMRKRLGIAQALLNDPDLLLLDEPTAGMDPLGCREVKDLILNLAKRGKTVVMSSHLLADIQDVCSQVMILYGGKTQAVGSIQDLLSKSDEMLIRTPNLSADAELDIQKVISNYCPEQKAIFEHPVCSLEDYFISIVNQARIGQETSGAHAGAGVAEYLKADSQEELEKPDLASLELLKKAEVEPVENIPQIDQARLDLLTRDNESSEKNEVDKATLDILTRKR